MTAAVYRVTHIATGRVYVGKTCRKDGRHRYRWVDHVRLATNGSKTYFHGAIRKYGVDAFEFEVIDRCVPSMLNTLERLWITILRANIKGFGFNNTAGGDGGRVSDEAIEKMRAAKLGKSTGPFSAERKEKIRQSKLGKPRRPETIARMKATRAVTVATLTPEWRKNISEGLRRTAKFKLTEEEKAEVRASALPSTHLAHLYGVHSCTIRRVRNPRQYKPRAEA